MVRKTLLSAIAAAGMVAGVSSAAAEERTVDATLKVGENGVRSVVISEMPQYGTLDSFRHFMNENNGGATTEGYMVDFGALDGKNVCLVLPENLQVGANSSLPFVREDNLREGLTAHCDEPGDFNGNYVPSGAEVQFQLKNAGSFANLANGASVTLTYDTDHGRTLTSGYVSALNAVLPEEKRLTWVPAVPEVPSPAPRPEDSSSRVIDNNDGSFTYVCGMPDGVGNFVESGREILNWESTQPVALMSGSYSWDGERMSWGEHGSGSRTRMQLAQTGNQLRTTLASVLDGDQMADIVCAANEPGTSYGTPTDAERTVMGRIFSPEYFEKNSFLGSSIMLGADQASALGTYVPAVIGASGRVDRDFENGADFFAQIDADDSVGYFHKGGRRIRLEFSGAKE